MGPSTAQPQLWLPHGDEACGEDGRGLGNACYSNRAAPADSGNQRPGAERFPKRATVGVLVEVSGAVQRGSCRVGAGRPGSSTPQVRDLKTVAVVAENNVRYRPGSCEWRCGGGA